MEREGDRGLFGQAIDVSIFHFKHQTLSDSDFMRDSRSVLPTVVLLKFVALR